MKTLLLIIAFSIIITSIIATALIGSIIRITSKKLYDAVKEKLWKPFDSIAKYFKIKTD